MSLLIGVEESACSHSCGAEKDEAREIQNSLLPSGTLHSASVEIAYRFSPFAEVGGDFADFFILPNGIAGLYIGDVVGKGLAAAMYAALVMGTLRGINKTDEQTSTILAVLNKRLFVRPVQGRFATTLYAAYDPGSRELTFSNAGMPYPVRASASGCQQLKEGGLPSGMFPGSSYNIHRVQLEPGDSVLFATDGLHELQNSGGDDFGWARMGEIWGKCREASADEALECLLHEAMRFAVGGFQHDDITAIALKIPLL
ncbi:MAG TPA: PP2C family protein-serine/threonine phosphatase [Candidatus Acidoferrales bacterium]|nr:PP2C family protein-serine/threonine phosphatase [Candidatus Acidoferrales bacterium]